MAKAKKPEINLNIFSKTGEPTEEQPQDKIKPVGIGLKASEWQRLEEIAGELGVTRHNLSMYILRDFIRRYEKGERPRTRTRTTTELDMPE